MIKARCTRACIWKERYWNVGDIYEGKDVPPKHFVIREKQKDDEKEDSKKEDPKEKKEEG
jgi:hypothetical protein